MECIEIRLWRHRTEQRGQKVNREKERTGNEAINATEQTIIHSINKCLFLLGLGDISEQDR